MSHGYETEREVVQKSRGVKSGGVKSGGVKSGGVMG
jgi:hypothetical protein